MNLSLSKYVSSEWFKNSIVIKDNNFYNEKPGIYPEILRYIFNHSSLNFDDKGLGPEEL